MAATMGFSKMAELTHKMEDVLAKFREGELKVTQKVVTVLFTCLDNLERMVNNISEGIEDNTEIEGIIKDLESIAKNDVHEGAIDMDESHEDMDKKSEIIDLNEYDLNVIKQAVQRGFNAFQIKITLSENTLLKSARAFLIFKT